MRPCFFLHFEKGSHIRRIAKIKNKKIFTNMGYFFVFISFYKSRLHVQKRHVSHGRSRSLAKKTAHTEKGYSSQRKARLSEKIGSSWKNRLLAKEDRFLFKIIGILTAGHLLTSFSREGTCWRHSRGTILAKSPFSGRSILAKTWAAVARKSAEE